MDTEQDGRCLVCAPTRCDEPLPRSGSFAFSIVFLACPSLFGDGPVLTGRFPFLSACAFLMVLQQSSNKQTDDDVILKDSLKTRQLPNTHVRPFYRTLPPILKSNSSYGFNFTANADGCNYRKNSSVKLSGVRSLNGISKLHMRVCIPEKSAYVHVSAVDASLQLWHERLCHQNKRHAQQVLNSELPWHQSACPRGVLNRFCFWEASS
ncbi:hypothetical protein T07_2010 [Trichinella nelsoni]|uniref:GAG-pre-integrase domain-containing protein n=1 Tax=Trichinella nelsoni TaxID=6336 RepID=A0A0V0SH76_9BILA|nr:hypothetical protein T07_2010 [Trichinella nelsoni]